MNKIISQLQVKFLLIFILLSLVVTNNAAAIIQNPKLINMNDGFLELKPNGSLILHSSLSNSSHNWEEAIAFRTILNAIRLMPLQTKNTLSDLNQKIYGDGVEHRFPPFLERVIQRIQTYFSVYKYTDTSQTVREEKKPTSTTTMKTTSSLTATSLTISGLLNKTLILGQNEIKVNSTSDGNNGLNRINNTSLNMYTFKHPLKASTSTTTTKPALEYDEEKEFIEKKNRKSFENKKS